MNNIIYDDIIIITPEDNIWGYYNNFLKKIDKKDCVKFTLFCAKIVNNNNKENNACIELVEKWLIDEKSVILQELHNAADAAYSAADAWATYSAADTWATYSAADTAYSVYYYAIACITVDNAITYSAYAVYDAYYAAASNAIIDIINKYLQILLRKTKQFQNNKILEQISKTDVDKLELVDWNMITDIMQEEYNIVHEFDYENIFSRRCLIELLRREYL